MHIKQITIRNFRSFRQQAENPPFSPATNALVGRNGSGKSNLFDAVQFCLLAPKFANLRQEDRQALLHEGSGSAAVNAFVEIVFDNSDHRFALENSDEVVLRRTVGLKKDEFFLQRKRANKQEVLALLEGAGFSKSNPYFIVQQGKVQNLCLMKDEERLRLLKEVAGTVVYDEKKTESLAKMQETDLSIKKTAEMLDDIDTRLQELQQEKQELTAYTALDRERRAVEYTLYDKELRKARATLDALEHERSDHAEEMHQLGAEEQAKKSAIREIKEAIKDKTKKLHHNQHIVKELEEDKTAKVTEYTKLQLECQELQESLQQSKEQLAANQAQLIKLQAEMEKTQKTLDKDVQPNYDKAVAELRNLTNERGETKRQMDALYAKQGRGRQFKSKEERDAHLQSQVADLQTGIDEKKTLLTQEQDTLSNLRRTVDKESKDIATYRDEATKQAEKLQAFNKSIAEKKRERLQVHDERKEEWRKGEELRESVREARESVHRATSDLRKVMPRATAMGLKALATLVEKEKLVVPGEQYFGTLMDNFELTHDKYQTAVEMAAQNSLFHVIVDNDQTAALLMTRLEQDKLGRVTFLPLSQLRVEKNIKYPDSSNNDVKPMLDLCIKYDKKVDRAMRHVFEKKLLARTTELASEWSTKLSMDVITLDGDLCSRKGALTGGYVDVNKSRLRAQAAEKEAQATLDKLQSEYGKVNRKTQQADQKATNLMHELQRLEAKHAEATRFVNEKEGAAVVVQARLENHKKQIDKVEKTSIPTFEGEIAALEAEMERLKEEIGTELTQTLSDQDRELLDQLKQTQADLVSKIDSQEEKVSQVGLERQKLQSLLEDNLRKRYEELTEAIAGNDDTTAGDSRRRRSSVARLSGDAVQAMRKEELEDRQRQLDDAARVKDTITARLEEARGEEEQIRGDLHSSQNELEQLESQFAKTSKAWEEGKIKTDRIMNKRSMCISKRETYMRKIQELGSLPPPSELEKFSRMSISNLMKSLEGVNKKIKKYSHVNKKAFDQYMNFNEQRESLLARKEGLDQDADKVRELIDSLDRQKDEAINRTFRGVSKHFKEVFKELVPNGSGELIMRTAMDEKMEQETDDEDSSKDSDEEESPKKKKAIDPSNPDVSLYTGVGINVQFSAAGENYMMSQLSGGQKALVALALIFAIQRCDPAPFYLFDELDQALDSTYRAAVANLIQRQANNKDNPTQFIVSTFRPELVSIANRCYGMSLQNKVSTIHPLSKKDALFFIANLMNEEEAVGDVTSVNTSKATASASRDSRKRKSMVRSEEASDNEEEDEDEDEEDDEADAMEEERVAADESSP